MRRFSTASRLALTSSTFAIAAGLATGASAEAAPVTTQTATPTTTVTSQDVQNVPTNSTNPADVIPQTTAANAPAGPGITVTGSRIRRPNLESVVPVTSIQGEQFFQRGNPDVGEALNDLPQLRSTFAQQNPGTGIGIAGLNLLDLRGLGTKRTLVLVNGRRHVGSDVTSTASVPDVNTIPADLIDRVDIVTGGNSAVYGSDAIAGVVNFILKRDFNGVQVRAQGSEAAAGFGTSYYGSILAGHNFGGGKGNVTIDAEYTHENRVFTSDIPWYRTQNGYITVDVDPGGLPNGSDGFPDRIFATDIRSSTVSIYGLVPITQPAANPACGVAIGSTNGAPANTGSPYNCTYIFNPDGSMVAQTGTRTGNTQNPVFLGGNGSTTREAKIFSVFPENTRYNLNLVGHYTISDAFEPFVEATFARTETRGNNAGTSFIQGTFGTGDIRERIRLDNPFLDPTARTTVTSQLLASGCNPSLTASCTVGSRSTYESLIAPTAAAATTFCTTNPNDQHCQNIGGSLTASDIARINAGTYRFVLSKRFADIGVRDEHFRRDTYRAVAGVRGTFNTDWSYELSANYGEFDEHKNVVGFFDRQKFSLAMDAGRNPVTGQIQCRSQFDPTAAFRYDKDPNLNAAQIAMLQARLAADIAACVPYNPFGDPGTNDASINYFTTNEHKSARLTELDFLGFVNGNSSKLFSLPGGPIDFVLGGEYRRETARYIEDPYVDFGDPNNTPGAGSVTTDVDVGTSLPKPFHVAEAFGEIHLPILKDVPFFHELTLSGAGRYSRYKKTIGNVWTYNFGGEWAPVKDIRFRGNFGKAVRAPNLAETAFAQVPNFAPTFIDPCSQTGLSNGGASRTTNCQADLGALLPTVRNVAYSLPVINGSNPLLVPETSYSLTLGGVLQPRFIPGFSLSVDYYNIKVKSVIVALTAQQITNLCYDQPSLSNVYCGLFTRFRGPGTGPNGEQPGDVLGNSLIQSGVNFAKRIRRGIDINANYRARLGSKVVLDSSLIWVHGIKSSNYNNPSLPNQEDRILSELGDPDNEGRLDLDLKVGNVTFGYNGHYIAPMYVDTAEDFIAVPAACPPGQTTPGVGGCPPTNIDFAENHKYQAITYHGIRVQWDTGPAFGMLKNIQVYAGVDNIFDQHPPGGLTATAGNILGTGNAGIYDVFGRKFYGGVKVRY
jgi:outer membrane receptor protein involved in Fe transport